VGSAIGNEKKKVHISSDGTALTQVLLNTCKTPLMQHGGIFTGNNVYL